MLDINCLLNTRPLVKNLEALVEYTGYALAAAGKRPTLGALYNELRSGGIEVDIQTVGNLYLQVFPVGSDAAFSTRAEVDKAIRQSFDTLARKTHTALRARPIGRDSPAVAVAESLFKLLAPDVGSNPTTQRLLQDALLKWAKRKIGPIQRAQAAPKSWTDIVADALQLELYGAFTVGPTTIGTMENAQRLTEELKNEFKDMLAEIKALNPGMSPYLTQDIEDAANKLAATPHSLLMSTAEARAVIAGILSEAHLHNEDLMGQKLTRTTTRNGQQVEQIHWPTVISLVGAQFLDLNEMVDKAFGSRYTPAQIQLIQNSLANDFNEILMEKKAKELKKLNDAADPNKARRASARASDYDRMIYLNELGIFTNQNKDALYKIVGVNDMTQEELDSLRTILDQTQVAYRTPINQWSPTFMLTLQRLMENELERIEEAHSGMIKSVRRMSFLNQLGTSVLLLRPLNIAQNFYSGLLHTATAVVMNPKTGPKALSMWVNTFASVLGGGVRVGAEMSDTFARQGNLEERYNFQTAKGMKGKVAAGASLASRAFLTATDAAYKSVIVHAMLQRAALKTLMKLNPGLKKAEAVLLLNEAQHFNTDEIEKVADRMLDVLRAVGHPVRSNTKRRIMAELAYTNLMHDGKGLQAVLADMGSNKVSAAEQKRRDRAYRKAGIDPAVFKTKAIKGLQGQLIRAMQSAAVTAAGRSLGHEGDTIPVRWLTDEINKRLGRAVEDARRSRDAGALASAEALKLTWYTFTRFRSGGFRWLAMGLFKNPAAATLMYLVNTPLGARMRTSNLNQPGISWNPFDPNFDAINLEDATAREMEEGLTEYLHIRDRNARYMVLGTIEMILAAVLIQYAFNAFKEFGAGADEDDEEPLGAGVNPEEYQKRKLMTQVTLWMLTDPTRRSMVQKFVGMYGYAALSRYMEDVYRPDKGTVTVGKELWYKQGPKPLTEEWNILDTLLEVLNPNPFQPFFQNYSLSPIVDLLTQGSRDVIQNRGEKLGEMVGEMFGEALISPLFAPFELPPAYKNLLRALKGQATGLTTFEKENLKHYRKGLSGMERILRGGLSDQAEVWTMEYMSAQEKKFRGELAEQAETRWFETLGTNPAPPTLQALALQLPRYRDDLTPNVYSQATENLEYKAEPDKEGNTPTEVYGVPVGSMLVVNPADNPELDARYRQELADAYRLLLDTPTAHNIYKQIWASLEDTSSDTDANLTISENVKLIKKLMTDAETIAKDQVLIWAAGNEEQRALIIQPPKTATSAAELARWRREQGLDSVETTPARLNTTIERQ